MARSSRAAGHSGSYVQLADENSAVDLRDTAISQNDAVMYSHRISRSIGGTENASVSSHGSGGSGRYSSRVDPTSTYRAGGAASSQGKGKGKAPGHWKFDEEDEGDIGERTAFRNNDYDSPNNGVSPSVDTSSYPPVNESEEEEKRIQENLAKFSAREAARRKAARVSRSGPFTSSPNSSTSSLSRLSSVSGTIRRMRGKGGAPKEGMELDSAQTYNNPYEPSPPSTASSSPTVARGPHVVPPTMSGSSPFADPPLEDVPSSSVRTQASSAPVPQPQPGTFGYAGPEWRGGAAATECELDGQAITPAKPVKEKWWHSLCAWGSDLDGGHGQTSSNQAGRTNPFE